MAFLRLGLIFENSISQAFTCGVTSYQVRVMGHDLAITRQ